jgi:hypothetical protein
MVKLKVGHEQAKALQNYEDLCSVVSQALGMKKGAHKPQPISNTAQAKAVFADIFGPQAVKGA